MEFLPTSISQMSAGSTLPPQPSLILSIPRAAAPGDIYGFEMPEDEDRDAEARYVAMVDALIRSPSLAPEQQEPQRDDQKRTLAQRSALPAQRRKK